MGGKLSGAHEVPPNDLARPTEAGRRVEEQPGREREVIRESKTRGSIDTPPPSTRSRPTVRTTDRIPYRMSPLECF